MSKTKRPCDGKDVFVAAPPTFHADDMILGQLWRDLHHDAPAACLGSSAGMIPSSAQLKLERLQALL